MRFVQYYQARQGWIWVNRCSVNPPWWMQDERSVIEKKNGILLYFLLYLMQKDPREKSVFQPTLIWSHEQSTKWVSLQAITDIFGLINPQLGLLHYNQSTWITHCWQMKSTHLEEHVSLIAEGILLFCTGAWEIELPGDFNGFKGLT